MTKLGLIAFAACFCHAVVSQECDKELFYLLGAGEATTMSCESDSDVQWKVKVTLATSNQVTVFVTFGSPCEDTSSPVATRYGEHTSNSFYSSTIAPETSSNLCCVKVQCGSQQPCNGNLKGEFSTITSDVSAIAIVFIVMGGLLTCAIVFVCVVYVLRSRRRRSPRSSRREAPISFELDDIPAARSNGQQPKGSSKTSQENKSGEDSSSVAEASMKSMVPKDAAKSEVLNPTAPALEPPPVRSISRVNSNLGNPEPAAMEIATYVPVPPPAVDTHHLQGALSSSEDNKDPKAVQLAHFAKPVQAVSHIFRPILQALGTLSGQGQVEIPAVIFQQ